MFFFFQNLQIKLEGMRLCLLSRFFEELSVFISDGFIAGITRAVSVTSKAKKTWRDDGNTHLIVYLLIFFSSSTSHFFLFTFVLVITTFI
jgi:hypothetical protein